MDKLDFSCVVICEDIRREVTDKLMLIGVYTGDVVVPFLPASVQLAAYVELRNVTAGHHSLPFRVALRGKPNMGGVLHIESQADGTVGFVIPPLQIVVEENTEFVLSFKNGDEFEEIKTKKIYVGKTVEPFGVSSASPSAAPVS